MKNSHTIDANTPNLINGQIMSLASSLPASQPQGRKKNFPPSSSKEKLSLGQKRIEKSSYSKEQVIAEETEALSQKHPFLCCTINRSLHIVISESTQDVSNRALTAHVSLSYYCILYISLNRDHPVIFTRIASEFDICTLPES